MLDARPGSRPSGVPGRVEDHLQVQLLRQADHVEQPVGPQLGEPVADRGQVGRVVAETAVGLAHDQRQRLACTIAVPGREHAQRAVALLDQAAIGQFLHDVGEPVVVAALAREVRGRQQDVEQPVDDLEVGLRLVDQDPPQAQRRLVAALQEHHPLPRPGLEGLVAVELLPRRLVEPAEVAGRELVCRLGLADVEQMLDQHPEGRAPLTDVVLPDDRVPQPFEQPDGAVADDRRTQVADVHLLRGVRPGVVDDHPLGGTGARHAQPCVRAHRGGQSAGGVLTDRQIDVSRPGDLDARAQIGDLQPGDHLVRELPRIAAHPACPGERAFGLEVSSLRRAQHRIDGDGRSHRGRRVCRLGEPGGHGGEGGCEARLEFVVKSCHTSKDTGLFAAE